MQTLLVATRKGLSLVRGKGAQWAIAAHQFAGDPVTQVLADRRRYPLDGKMVINRTDDGGTTITTFTDGPPQETAYHLVYRHSLELAPDRQTLAMSSTTGGLWISADAGEHWHCVRNDLPPVAALGWVAT
jgi:hypothetical protein